METRAMPLKLKLAIAFAGSLILVAGLCLLFLGSPGPPERRAAEPPAPTKPAAVAHAPVAVKKAEPAAVARAPEEVETRPARAEPAAADGGWRITGRIVGVDSKTGTVVPVEGVIVLLKPPPRGTK